MAPNEKKNGLQALLNYIDKRSNGIVAIIKNIEKDKIDRMHGMMIMLFGLGNAQEKLPNQSTAKSAAKNDTFDPQYKDVFDKIELNHKKNTLEWEVKEVKRAFHNFLEKKSLWFVPG